MAIINGTAGDDFLIGTIDADTINGFAGNDFIQGGEGDDTLDGGDDHDLINGQQGNDTITGGNGDDLIRPGSGDDIVDGGAGFDRVSYASVGSDVPGTGVTVSLLLQGVAQDTGHGMDILNNIEHLTGTAFNDVLTGDGGDNWLWGSIDPATGGPGGDDTLSGGGGNDLLEIGAGNHLLDGGAGSDSLSFGSSETAITGGVTFSLALQGAAQATGQGSMTASGLENLSGSAYGDTLSGDSGDNILAGNIGNDTLSGGAGNDTLYGDGQIRPDTHGLGYSGPIIVDPDAAATFALTPGNDVLDGGAGDDILNGGGGNDTASFASWTERVFAGLNNLGNCSANNGTGTEHDTLISIENLTGSAYNDSLSGNNFANVLDGGDGHDNLFGRGGDDVMIGGDGDDFLRGSDGADVLDGGAGWDRVSSFLAVPTVGITFDLNIQGVAQDTGQGMDVLTGIEHASGTVLNDTLIGNGGDNWLWDGADGDPATIGTGDDTITAGAGNDLVETGGGNETLSGGDGIDTWSFLGGQSEISAAGVTASLALQGAAQNTEQGMMTATGFENLSGSLFDDSLTGDANANILLGDLGNDTLRGGDGNDALYGDGRMHVDSHQTGGSGPITLFGDAAAEFDGVGGNDTLFGGKGDDALYGGLGDDLLTGGQGADSFIFDAESGDDVISDFKGQDEIVFSGVAGIDDFGDLTLSASGAHDTLVTWGTTDSILIEGVKPNQLSASDFSFGATAAASIGFVQVSRMDAHDIGQPGLWID